MAAVPRDSWSVPQRHFMYSIELDLLPNGVSYLAVDSPDTDGRYLDDEFVFDILMSLVPASTIRKLEVVDSQMDHLPFAPENTILPLYHQAAIMSNAREDDSKCLIAEIIGYDMETFFFNFRPAFAGSFWFYYL